MWVLRFVLASALIGGVFAPTHGIAQTHSKFNARYWLPVCQQVVEQRVIGTGPTGACAGYIMAIADAVDLGMMPHFRFCIPEKTVRSELISSVVSFLKERPDKLDDPFALAIIQAFILRWPCKR